MKHLLITTIAVVVLVGCAVLKLGERLGFQVENKKETAEILALWDTCVDTFIKKKYSEIDNIEATPETRQQLIGFFFWSGWFSLAVP